MGMSRSSFERASPIAVSEISIPVTDFTSPLRALEAFREHPYAFDAVVTDVSMPHLSGPEFSRALLAIRPDLPIVMTSGSVGPEDQRAARELGIRELVGKSDSVEEIALALEREPLHIALRALSAEEDAIRGTALEYLEVVLPPGIRESLWPHITRKTIARSTSGRSRKEVEAELLRARDGALAREKD